MSDEGIAQGDVSQTLVRVEPAQFIPAMTIEAAVERYNTVTEFVSRVLRRNVDYGVIPGTDKSTLLKPGAEKSNSNEAPRAI